MHHEALSLLSLKPSQPPSFLRDSLLFSIHLSIPPYFPTSLHFCFHLLLQPIPPPLPLPSIYLSIFPVWDHSFSLSAGSPAGQQGKWLKEITMITFLLCLFEVTFRNGLFGDFCLCKDSALPGDLKQLIIYTTKTEPTDFIDTFYQPTSVFVMSF